MMNDGSFSILEGSFEETIQDSYYRVAKKTGQKNIRCFPLCSPKGHVNSGFCGTSLTAHVHVNISLLPNQVFRVWGEFVQCGADKMMLMGQKMPLGGVMKKERCRTNPQEPWVRGEISSNAPGTLQIVFNQQLLGWHYSWVSTKHTSATRHAFKMYLFVLDQYNQELTFQGDLTSESFSLYSKKKTTGDEEEGPAQKRKRVEEAESSTDEAKVNTHVLWSRPNTTDPEFARELRRQITIDRVLRMVVFYSNSPAITDSARLLANRDSSFNVTDAELEWLLSSNGAEENAVQDDDGDSLIEESLELGKNHIKTFDDLLLFGRDTLRKHLSPATYANLDQIIGALSSSLELAEDTSVEREDFRLFVEKWKQPSMIEKLHEDSRAEALVTRILPDGGIDSRAPTIVDELYLLHVNAGEELIGRLGMKWEDFEDFVNVCCKLRIVPCDSFYPPVQRYAAMVHVLLYGTLQGFAKQDFGSAKGCFRNMEQAMEWSTAYWKMRRSNLARSITNTILYRPADRLPPGDPIPKDIDFNGVWFNINSSSFLASKGHRAKQSEQAGWASGGFCTKLFDAMWSQLSVKMNSTAILLQGKRVLLTDPVLTFYMDRTPRRRQAYQPLPSAMHTTTIEEVCWVHRAADGSPGINVVAKSSALPWQLEEFLKQYSNLEGQAEPPTASNVLICKRCILSKDGNRLFLTNLINVFPKEKTPSLSDHAAMNALFNSETNSRVDMTVLEYAKLYNGDQVDSVLDTDMLDML